MAIKSKTKNSRRKGTLIIIGGHEDKENERTILKEVARQTGKAKLVLVTVASEIPEEVWKDYKKAFSEMGLTNMVHFSISRHDQASEAQNISLFDNARTVFFTGGDQLKITTKIGGSPVFERILEIYDKGGIIVGTSAGAAIMGRTMLVGGENSESHKVGNWMMAPGLGFVENVVVDQHFAQRGRIGRLLGAVSLNPGILGIGIDEDTSIVVKENSFQVIGTNAVYVIDGKNVSSTNISEAAASKTMSMHHVSLHILAHLEKFDLERRVPARGSV